MVEAQGELNPFKNGILNRFKAGQIDVFNVMAVLTLSGLTLGIPESAAPYVDKDRLGRTNFFLDIRKGRRSYLCGVSSFKGPVVVSYKPKLDYGLEGFRVHVDLFQRLQGLETPHGKIILSDNVFPAKLGGGIFPLRILSYCHMIKALRGKGYCSFIDDLVQYNPVLCGNAQCEMGNDLPPMTEYGGSCVREKDSVLFKLRLLEEASDLEVRVSFENGVDESFPYGHDLKRVLNLAAEIDEGERIEFGRRHNTFMYRLPLV
mgnify:CR=1 FL=1